MLKIISRPETSNVPFTPTIEPQGRPRGRTGVDILAASSYHDGMKGYEK